MMRILLRYVSLILAGLTVGALIAKATWFIVFDVSSAMDMDVRSANTGFPGGVGPLVIKDYNGSTVTCLVGNGRDMVMDGDISVAGGNGGFGESGDGGGVIIPSRYSTNVICAVDHGGERCPGYPDYSSDSTSGDEGGDLVFVPGIGAGDAINVGLAEIIKECGIFHFDGKCPDDPGTFIKGSTLFVDSEGRILLVPAELYLPEGFDVTTTTLRIDGIGGSNE